MSEDVRTPHEVLGMLARLATQVLTDHLSDGAGRCAARSCGEPWPCRPRQVAEVAQVISTASYGRP